MNAKDDSQLILSGEDYTFGKKLLETEKLNMKDYKELVEMHNSATQDNLYG